MSFKQFSLLSSGEPKGAKLNARSLTKETRDAVDCGSSSTGSDSGGFWESGISRKGKAMAMSSASVSSSVCYQALALVQLIFVLALLV